MCGSALIMRKRNLSVLIGGLVWCTSLLLAGYGDALGQAAPAPATSACRVAAVIPQTNLSRPSGAKLVRKEASKGADVAWNDILQTGKSGRVRIQLNDQSILTLGSDSTLRVVKHEAARQQTALQLGYGRIRCEVTKLVRSGGNFELTTPTAVAGVIGTDFGVDASDPDVTKFICISGNVQITSVDPGVSGAITCRGGTTVTVRRGQPPESPERATRDQMETWKTITEPDQSPPKDPYKTY